MLVVFFRVIRSTCYSDHLLVYVNSDATCLQSSCFFTSPKLPSWRTAIPNAKWHTSHGRSLWTLEKPKSWPRCHVNWNCWHKAEHRQHERKEVPGLNKQTNKQTDKQTDKQTNKKPNKQNKTKQNKQNKQTNKQTNTYILRNFYHRNVPSSNLSCYRWFHLKTTELQQPKTSFHQRFRVAFLWLPRSSANQTADQWTHRSKHFESLVFQGQVLVTNPWETAGFSVRGGKGPSLKFPKMTDPWKITSFQ